MVKANPIILLLKNYIDISMKSLGVQFEETLLVHSFLTLSHNIITSSAKLLNNSVATPLLAVCFITSPGGLLESHQDMVGRLTQCRYLAGKQFPAVNNCFPVKFPQFYFCKLLRAFLGIRYHINCRNKEIGISMAQWLGLHIIISHNR